MDAIYTYIQYDTIQIIHTIYYIQDVQYTAYKTINTHIYSIHKIPIDVQYITYNTYIKNK